MKEFEPKRRPCGNAITILSLENYEEMHTHSGSFLFRMQRRFEGVLARVFKGRIVMPLYYAVAFTDLPYDQVLRYKRKKAKIETALKIASGIALGVGLLASITLSKQPKAWWWSVSGASAKARGLDTALQLS